MSVFSRRRFELTLVVRPEDFIAALRRQTTLSPYAAPDAIFTGSVQADRFSIHRKESVMFAFGFNEELTATVTGDATYTKVSGDVTFRPILKLQSITSVLALGYGLYWLAQTGFPTTGLNALCCAAFFVAVWVFGTHPSDGAQFKESFQNILSGKS